jgi:hypothetical protein
MEPHSANSDDLSRLERRLSAWQPAEAGLDADALLFAAGRASVRPGPARFVWPALTAFVALLAIVLGVRLTAERGERLALVQRLQQVTAKASPSLDLDSTDPSSDIEPRPDSFLMSHRLLETGLDGWPAEMVVRAEISDAPSPEPPVLRAGRRDVLLDP